MKAINSDSIGLTPIHDDVVSLVQSLPVDNAQFERLLERALANVENPEEGFFGPDSVLWKIMQFNYPWLIGASRMLILQAIHLWMTQAGTDYSYGFKYPMKRAVNTFMMMSQIIFGDKDTAVQTAVRIRQIHNHIQGELKLDNHPFPDDHYQANDANALLWVHSTLWETTVLTYELLYSPLKPEEKEKLYRELTLLGMLFGIPEETMPNSWESFIDYNRAILSSDILSGEGRSKELGNYFLNELNNTMPRIFAPFFFFLREFTIGILPQEVRSKMGLSHNPIAASGFLWSMRFAARFVWVPIPYNGLFVQNKARLARLKANKTLTDRYWLFLVTTPMSFVRLTTLIFLSRRKIDDGMSSRNMILQLVKKNR